MAIFAVINPKHPWNLNQRVGQYVLQGHFALAVISEVAQRYFTYFSYCLRYTPDGFIYKCDK